MHARTHATACAQRYVLVLFRNRQRGQYSKVHTRAPHAHMHTGDRTRELVQGTACSLVAAIGRLQELARSGLDLCGASSARQRRAGSVKQASLSLRRLLRCTRHRTWGTPTVLSSCSASTSRSHMPGSSTRSREVRFIATWRGAEQFVVCQAGPRRGPSGRGRGMSDLWQSFRNAIRGSEVCAAVLPPCILGAACLSALSLPRSRCHVLASRAQLALCGVRGACVHPGAYRGALMCSWSCSFCADYAHDFADGGLFHYEVCAACACTRCCGPRVCACARVQRSCRLPHACRIHPMCSHCAGGCRGLGARRAIKTRRAKRLCKQHRHR